MQKIINTLAVASAAVSLTVVGVGGYVYLNRDSIIDGVKKQLIESVTGSMGGALTGDVGIPSGEAAAVGGPTGAGLDLPKF